MSVGFPYSKRCTLKGLMFFFFFFFFFFFAVYESPRHCYIQRILLIQGSHGWLGS